MTRSQAPYKIPNINGSGEEVICTGAEDLVVKGSRTFSVNPYLMASTGEHFVLNVSEFSKVKKRELTTQEYNSDVWACINHRGSYSVSFGKYSCISYLIQE